VGALATRACSHTPRRQDWPMNLTNLFRLHAILAALYALGLVFVPQFTIGLLSPLPLNAVGTDISRLFGAALVLVTFTTWRASRLADRPARRMFAGGLLVYSMLGVIITAWGQFAGTWSALGWSSIISYLVFVLGYGYFLFLKPE
jgi:hypothetical protein